MLSHVVSYGSSVFEGIRCYETTQGPATFRLRDHMRRLVNSGHIYRMENPYSRRRSSAPPPHEVVRANHLSSCYIRPWCCAAMATLASARCKCPIEVYIACWEWGAYLGPEALEQGVDVCVSSWARMAPNTLPAMAKAGANYMNSQLIRMEAAANGYAEGIALDTNGYVSEGSGENIFLVQDGVVSTPPLASSVLPGITRNSIIALCEDLAHPRARADDSARDAVHRRRGFLHRHRRRSDAAALDRPHQDRRGQARPHHQAAARGVLRHPHRRQARPSQLADAGVRTRRRLGRVSGASVRMGVRAAASVARHDRRATIGKSRSVSSVTRFPGA